MRQIRQQLDPKSLQFRLTLGTTLVTIVGMGSVAGWISWRTEAILIGSHKQAVHEMASRVPQDIEAYIYKDMMEMDEAVQRAIDVRSLPAFSIALADANGDILVEPTREWHDSDIVHTLTAQNNVPFLPAVRTIDSRHYVICAQNLEVKGQAMGLLHIALDITDDRIMFRKLMQALSLVTLLAMGLMAIAIAIYVRRALRSLRQMSQMTKFLSVEELAHSQLKLGAAPTEVKELAITCEHSLSRLSNALNHQQQFVRDISHELRTPLSIVSGYLQSLLRRRKMFTEPQREALETAATEADHTIRLLQDLLNLERAESGQMRLNLSTVILNDLVDDVVKMAITSSYRDIDLDMQVDYPIKAHVDPDSLRQVLAQLIDNALQYSESEQVVTVRLTQSDSPSCGQHPDFAEASALDRSNASSYAIIQVCDRGVGIPLQHQSRIFDQCYRVDSNRSRSTGGCGIGLSIVKVLVEGMGGTVSVRSKPNQGSIFTVTLPTNPNTYEHPNRSRGRRRKIGSVH
ncbi:MAG: HAMP domain-containing sensor histidine kinase [Cyanobacteria bacterium P01_F01_bin.150]